jgi:hypothetical protein
MTVRLHGGGLVGERDVRWGGRDRQFHYTHLVSDWVVEVDPLLCERCVVDFAVHDGSRSQLIDLAGALGPALHSSVCWSGAIRLFLGSNYPIPHANCFADGRTCAGHRGYLVAGWLREHVVRLQGVLNRRNS